MGAVRRKFSPEFVNRIDTVITSSSRSTQALRRKSWICRSRLWVAHREPPGGAAFELEVTAAARQYLLQGNSGEYGARELKRTILRSYAAAGGDGGRGSRRVDCAWTVQEWVWRSLCATESKKGA
jgi:ATP-dependent Clp protease ATP-binding subunit ClpA